MLPVYHAGTIARGEGRLPVFGIRIDTERSPHKALLSSDVRLNMQILEILYAVAILEQRSWRSDYQLMEEIDEEDLGVPPASSKRTVALPLTMRAVRYSNPFDLVAVVKGVNKEIIDYVLNRTLFYKQEAERREIENAQKARALPLADQEVAVRKEDVKLKRQDVAMRRQEVALKRQEAELKKQEAVGLKLQNVEKALSLRNEVEKLGAERSPERSSRHNAGMEKRDFIMREVGEILADQGAQLGSGNVQVYFKPPPKPPTKKKGRTKTTRR